MPTYDYECKDCGHEFEAFQGMLEDVLRECPACGNASLRRLIGGGSGIIFRGSGFYINDSREAKANSFGGHGTNGQGSGATGQNAGESSGSEGSSSGESKESTGKSESKSESNSSRSA